MIKYTGHNISFKGLEHLLDLKSRMYLFYSKDSLSSISFDALLFKIEEESGDSY